MPQGAITEVEIGSMLKLATIDNFQGEESKVVILSTVRSNFDGRVGFLKTSNRINVGCSRARNGFYIVGNASLMRHVPMWNQIVKKLVAKQMIGPEFQACCPRHPKPTYPIRLPNQWSAIPTCQFPCEFELSCGHVCGLSCHAPSLHGRIGCTESCGKIYEECGHLCTKICGEPCGECVIEVASISLDCGHRAKLTCTEAAENKEKNGVRCKVVLHTTTKGCGHMQDVLCSAKEEELACKEKCESTLDCGHQCREACCTCTANRAHSSCTALCAKVLPCGHQCQAACHTRSCPPCQLPCQRSCKHGDCKEVCSQVCDPCVRPCDWTCEHMGACTTMCCLPCNRLPCSEHCTKVLPCGHLCPSLCGERCSTKCVQCTTGAFPEKLQMFLACGHHFDVEVLDSYVGIHNLYQLSAKSGHINGVHLSSMEQTFDMSLPYCPSCGEGCEDVRRYAIIYQLRMTEGNIDRVYSKLCRNLNRFLSYMHDVKRDLDDSFPGFAGRLRPGPLTGRTNERLVSERGNAMTDVQGKIQRFRDDVVLPFEATIASLPALYNILECITGADQTFRLRFDALFYRCRLITLDEAVRMLAPLEAMCDRSEHSSLLTNGIRRMTIEEAKQRELDIEASIQECNLKKMKRLETEFRLFQLCFQIVPHDLGARNFIGAEANLQRVLELCETFPDTAGLFMPSYQNIRRIISGYQQQRNRLYTSEIRGTWWSWPRHHVGHLKCCDNGHWYSHKAWPSGCPECGREVPKPEPVDPKKFLKEDAFVVAMRKTSPSFNVNGYRL